MAPRPFFASSAVHCIMRTDWFRAHRFSCAALLAALVCTALSLGCSPPKAVETCEFLIHYERMTDRLDPLVSLAYMPPDSGVAGYRTLVIRSLDVGTQWVEQAEQAPPYLAYFRTMFAGSLAKRKVFEQVITHPDPLVLKHAPGPVLNMDARVTVFHLGSGWGRYFSYWLMFLSSAATDFQIEARLTDADTGKLVMEFADRRRHQGNTPFGPSPKTLRNDFVMNYTIRLTAGSLAELLLRSGEGLPTDLSGPP